MFLFIAGILIGVIITVAVIYLILKNLPNFLPW